MCLSQRNCLYLWRYALCTFLETGASSYKEMGFLLKSVEA